MKYILILVTLFFSHMANARSVCDSQLTQELAQCAKSNYEEADAGLNRQYSSVAKNVSDAERSKLREVQRFWIAYKTRYCKDAFKSTNPGSEASIETWSCLESVTDSRSKELSFIYSSSGMRDFNSALAFMANEYEHGDRSKVIAKLVLHVPDANNLDWKRYTDSNCQITHEKLGEDHDGCVARMNFYKNW
ncbi:hypothetical protein AWB75_04057 [Caballeronia catudaia]|uniref:Lysozyme inhibitor LprI-like N-terminal domain-containing protein n=1 Tax=Caballeronia catudaia TaxID=1777136 RepID=A0A158BUT1_9BURK|nr:lysozyme inhibitor LprI family protein [Caballeronia catudaia]SAK73751.1 hypothetical protein AWB75_04057 [Caballeronia catudaia]